MEFLLKKDTTGNILEGSEKQLLAWAGRGDDLTIYIESIGYDEYIMFGNYVVCAGRVSGLSLPHLNHGDLSDISRLEREPISTVQYIYDSNANNLIAKDALDQSKTQTTLFFHNPAYRSYSWFSTRRYVDAGFMDLADLMNCGDQFKIRLDFSEDFKLIVKPDIIYFPHRGRDYLVKSSAMLLPASFVTAPLEYIRSGRAILDNEEFSTAYLNIGSDQDLVIIHKLRYCATGDPGSRILTGAISHHAAGNASVTRIQCHHTILIPAMKGD